MAEELTKTADELEADNRMTESERRIKQLSEKVRLTSEERDEQARLVKERDEKIAGLERDNAFATGYVDILSSIPEAKDFKDAIKEKVSKGYSVEDATFAVLGKAGKLGGAPIPKEVKNPAGGSADTAMPTGSKGVAEMTQAERRAALANSIGWE